MSSSLLFFLLTICFAILAAFEQMHWVGVALVAFFYVWNILQYRKGCFSEVVNEYDDQHGCPHNGLSRVCRHCYYGGCVVYHQTIKI